jgi:hypothetical protein
MGFIQRKEKDMTGGISLDLKRVIDQVSRDRGIDKQILITTLVEAIRQAAKKKLGLKQEIEVTYNEELGEVEVFEFKEVVEKVTDPQCRLPRKRAAFWTRNASWETAWALRWRPALSDGLPLSRPNRSSSNG